MNEENNKRYKVMIIDDNDTIRMLAQEFLSQEGFIVSEAVNGLQALEIIDSIGPDIILLDVEMPELNGFETCIRLRTSVQYRSTPILMLTGLDDSQSIDRAFTVGATEFATKPLNWTLLRHRLRYMLRASETINQLGESQHSLVAAQRIAQMGNWRLDVTTGLMEYSEHLYTLLGIQVDQSPSTFDTLLSSVHSEDKDSVQLWIDEARKSPQESNIDHRIINGDSSVLNVTQQLEPEYDSNGEVIFLHGIVQDVTERRKAEDKIFHLAYYDSLTDLPNRELFKSELDRVLANAIENAGVVAVLFIDLDDFKKVNDTFGHCVGDQLLQKVSRRLENSVRRIDAPHCKRYDTQDEVIARMGGDEYTILLSSINNAKEAEQVASRILQNLSKPYKIDSNDVFTSPSVGIALYPDSGDTADELLKNADMAMYCAKRGGKNLYMTHDREMSEEVQRRHKLDSQLRGAIDRGELHLHYQPQQNLSNGLMDGMEVLLRWNNVELGNVPPFVFIPIAEESGLIVAIGEWVMRTACYEAKQWLNDGFIFSRVAVNISVLQFLRPDFPDLVASILEESGLEPNTLELEITESLLAVDTEHAVQTLRKLKAIGVQLSIDDFGTGYSSLSQLKNYPIDRLKIDKSFIDGIAFNVEDAAIVNAIIAMAKSMKLKVLAEGVETVEQLGYLKENHCDEVQGFFLSHPLPKDDMRHFLITHSISTDNSKDQRKSA